MDVGTSVWSGELLSLDANSPNLMPQWQPPDFVDTLFLDANTSLNAQEATTPSPEDAAAKSDEATDPFDFSVSKPESILNGVAPQQQNAPRLALRSAKTTTDDDDVAEDSSDADAESKSPGDTVNKQQPLYSWAPQMQIGEVPFDPCLFSPSPDYTDFEYSSQDQWNVYTGKHMNATERPWVELGRGMYLPGRLPPSQTCLGDHNLVAQHFLVYGDYRMGTAYIDAAGNSKAVSAARLNLDVDWKLTDTERIHGFWGPIDRGASFTRIEAENGNLKFFDELDPNWDTIYFEGDVGSILGGWCGHDSQFDLPFAAGLMPLLFQNGIWMEDAFVGTAFTFTARHSRLMQWANYDVTFFTGFDKLNSPAFGTDDSAANVYGVTTFIEAYDGYLELGYAYLDDTRGLGRSYHNMSASFTRRYWHRVSNSVRVILNAGQDPVAGPRTADGCLVLFENALITSKPNTFVPYINAFAGFGRPQSVARAAVSGGILRNTGILFETDGLTGFPLLDDTGSNSYGGAIGLNWLADDFSHQVVLELATVQTFGLQAGRKAVDDQYGLGARYQKPLNQAWILRLDALYGFLDSADDLTGGRVELRYKF
ncbi:MAG: hypothetical protein KDB23_19840 [Planctomycetales bacterium]|nr:hypothetical protein [Planctomycetales bacterium]